MTSLAAGDLEVTVRGGDLLTVTSLRHRGEELLVAAGALPPSYRVHGRAAGITLLHPWANRLAADDYEVAGVGARVPAEDPEIARDANGLAIHGLAPKGAWDVTSGRAAGHEWAQATGSFGAHPAFPFPHELTAVFDLDGAGLRVTTELRPTGTVPVPVAFGWHPYFRLPGVPRADWRLELPARRRLALDERGIPTGAGREEAPETGPLADRTFDDGYDGVGDGDRLGIAGGGRAIRVVLVEGYPVAQVYAPARADVVSLEPMTAVTDALRSGHGLRLAQPGTTERATFAVEVSAEG